LRASQIINVAEGRVELREVDLPEPGRGELLIGNRVSMVSPGTERAFGLGLPGTPRLWPRPTGYSQVGVVLKAGEGVDIARGARVHSMAPHASACIAAADAVVPVPDGVKDEHAAFLTMLEIALQGVRKARIEIGDAVLVMGGGLIGQLAAQFAHVAGAAPVMLADISAHRRGLAGECGLATPVDPTREDHKKLIGAAGARGGPDAVLEVTGSPGPILDALAFAGRMGRVVLLGSTRGLAENVDFYSSVHKKGLIVVGAHNSIRPEADDSPGLWTLRGDATASLKLLQAGRLNLDPLITDEYPIAELQKAYSRLFEWDERLVGMVLRWPAAGGR